MSPSNILHLYLLRLRARAAQELLALVGIAAGVALLFASLVASNSLSSSIADLNAGVVGRATLQLLDGNEEYASLGGLNHPLTPRGAGRRIDP